MNGKNKRDGLVLPPSIVNATEEVRMGGDNIYAFTKSSLEPDVLGRESNNSGILFAMKKIAYKQLYRQALVLYAMKHGVTKAAIRYNETRQKIYRWMNRYDGTLELLCDWSHRPNSHPNQHTEAELKLISDMRKRNKHTGLVVLWVKLRQRGYTRSITGLYAVKEVLCVLKLHK